MKKSLILFLMITLAMSSFGRVLVYRMYYKGVEFKQKNTGNEMSRNIKEAFLVTDYNNATGSFGSPNIIYFWREDGKKMQKTESYGPSMSEITVNGEGRFAMGVQNDNTIKTRISNIS